MASGELSHTQTHTTTSQSLLSGREIYSAQKLRYKQRMEWPIDPTQKMRTEEKENKAH